MICTLLQMRFCISINVIFIWCTTLPKHADKSGKKLEAKGNAIAYTERCRIRSSQSHSKKCRRKNEPTDREEKMCWRKRRSLRPRYTYLRSWHTYFEDALISYTIIHITFVYPMRKIKMVYDFFVFSFLILAQKHISPFPWNASLISTKPALSRIRYWPWFFYVIFLCSARSRLVHRSFESLSNITSFYFRTQFFFWLDIRGINSRVCVVFSASLYKQQQ